MVCGCWRPDADADTDADGLIGGVMNDGVLYCGRGWIDSDDHRSSSNSRDATTPPTIRIRRCAIVDDHRSSSNSTISCEHGDAVASGGRRQMDARGASIQYCRYSI